MTVSYEWSARAAWACEGSQVVVLRLADLTAPPLSLDPIASAIWLALKGGASVHAVADRLASEFDAPLDTIRDDVAELVVGLLELGVIVASSDQGDA